ncbi:MAG: hypothetical protein K0Q55_2186 [Verrucomicrobia bacterium]|nr:hypothetical protein [Verrucomicrobiota bacterium]
MRLSQQQKSRQRASAIVAVMALASLFTVVMLVGNRRTVSLEREMKLLETKQKARLEAVSGKNTNQTVHGQNTRH